MQMVSNVGLAISGVTLIVSLPRITQTAGMGAFVADVAGQLWTMALRRQSPCRYELWVGACLQVRH
jgi:hypothetical protein